MFAKMIRLAGLFVLAQKIICTNSSQCKNDEDTKNFIAEAQNAIAQHYSSQGDEIGGQGLQSSIDEQRKKEKRKNVVKEKKKQEADAYKNGRSTVQCPIN